MVGSYEDIVTKQISIILAFSIISHSNPTYFPYSTENRFIMIFRYIRNELPVDAHDEHYTKLQLYLFLNRKLLVYCRALQRC